jgi:hypothetical protein
MIGMPAAPPVVEILIWGGVVIALALALGVAMMLLKRTLRQFTRAAPVGLTIQQLEEMREAGRITEEEFRALRRSVVGGPAEKSDCLLRQVREDVDGNEEADRAAGRDMDESQRNG